MHDALYRAYFVDARNIGDVDVLMDVVQSVGLPVDEARAVISPNGASRTRSTPTGRNRRSYGVTGVPTFVAGRHGVVGAQPYETLEKLVQQAGAVRRPASWGAPTDGDGHTNCREARRHSNPFLLRDHGVPHLHAIGPDFDFKFAVADGSIISGNGRHQGP